MEENRKRVVKNTLLLYVRMFLTMAIGLFTSRVVLNTLGVSDYGIYNVVGGIVTMLAFLNTGMVASSQRFLSYELGRSDLNRLKEVFGTSVTIHVVIALVIGCFAETIGLWFVNTHLNIDPDRMFAANCVYQASILTFMISVISVPYNSCIVAHERMSAFAYVSILESVLKLLIVYLLWVLPWDKLVVYGVLVVGVSALIRWIYALYCKKHFEECTYAFHFDRRLFNEMSSFAGWSVVGNMGFSMRDQMSNIILNLFYGTTLNAARGIAMQVSSVINTFSTNFTMAINPQITKQYASGHLGESQQLVYAAARYSFYLLMLISIPVMLHVDYILKLWLGIVPEYTGLFVNLTLLSALLYAVTQSVTVALQATGRIKVFQIGICLLMLSEIPMAYGLLAMGYSPYSVMYPTLLTNTIAIFFRFYLIKRMIPTYSVGYYCIQVLLRCLLIFTLSYFTCNWLKSLFHESFASVCGHAMLSLLIMLGFILVLGLNRPERIVIGAYSKKLKIV